MKFTLFAFEHRVSEMRDVATKIPTAFGEQLAGLVSQAVEVCAGIYVFETIPGYRDIHHLRHLLASTNKVFVELPFEGALAGFFSPSVANRLREIGKSSGPELSLLNLST